MEDCKKFIKKIKKLKLYMIEFKKDGAIKDKIYLLNCAIGGSNRQLVILITYDKCTFSTNNGI